MIALAAACVAARYGRRVRPVVLPQVVIAWPVVLVLALVWLHPAGRARLRLRATSRGASPVDAPAVPTALTAPEGMPGQRALGYLRLKGQLLFPTVERT